MTDSVHARHQRGDHSLCEYLFCEDRQAEEKSNRECLYAQAVLAAIRKRGGTLEGVLGEERHQFEAVAQRAQPDYLPQHPGPIELIKANMDVREAMAGVPIIWTCAEYDSDDDDFDVDEFLGQLA